MVKKRRGSLPAGVMNGSLRNLAIVILVAGNAESPADHWIVPVVVTEAGLLPAGAVAAVIGVSAPMAPMVNW
jgi:hypothetical protein